MTVVFYVFVTYTMCTIIVGSMSFIYVSALKTGAFTYYARVKNKLLMSQLTRILTNYYLSSSLRRLL